MVMLQPSDLRKMDAATPENPVFLTGAVGKWDYSGDDTELSYSGITAVTGRAEDEDHHGNPEYRLSVLKVNECGVDMSGKEANWRMGEYAVRSSGELRDTNLVDKTPELEQLYKDFQDLHKTAPYEVSGRLYSETPSYRSWDDEHKYPEYDEIKGTERTFDLSGATLKDGSPINSLEAAQCWMLENHEPLYIGMSAHQKCPGGDFMFGAVPSAYPEGYRETYENRRMYAQQDAERFGVMLSEENAHDILRELHAQKADELHQQTEAPKPRSERRLPDISGIDNGPDVNGPEY